MVKSYYLLMRSQGRSDRFVGLPMLTDWAIFFEHPQMLSSRVPLVLIKPVLRIDLVKHQHLIVSIHLSQN